jgi:large subunit ribosomal protein L15
MDLSNLKPAKGSVKTNKRLGRGQGSGWGGTSSKGHKGDKARSGHKTKRGFEGGQMPLQRRVPKFGFTNINKVYFKSINLDVIEMLANDKKITTFDIDTFVNNGLASKNEKIKVLGRGEIKTKVEVKAHAFSATAKAAIEAVGGKTETV